MTNPHRYGVQDVMVYRRGTSEAGVPWRGVKDIQFDRAYREERKIYNDGVLYDYLQLGEDVGVSVTCYNYPSIVEVAMGRWITATGVVYDGERPDPIGLVFRTEREDGKYSLVLVPQLFLTQTGTQYETMSESPLPVEHNLTGEILPLVGFGELVPFVVEIREGVLQSYYEKLLGAKARFDTQGKKASSEAISSELHLYKLLEHALAPSLSTKVQTLSKDLNAVVREFTRD